MPQNPETPDEVTAAVTGSSRRAQDGIRRLVSHVQAQLAAPPVELTGGPDPKWLALVDAGQRGGADGAGAVCDAYSRGITVGLDRAAEALAAGHDRDPQLADALGAATSLPRSELLPEARRLAAALDRRLSGDPASVVFKLVPFSVRAHSECRLYAGPDRDHLALCGTLRLRHHEYEALQDALTPPAQPTNTEERAEDAARRFATELEQLHTGLESRGIPLRDGPVGISAALTALAELDRLRRYIEQRDQGQPSYRAVAGERPCGDPACICGPQVPPAPISSVPQDRSGDGVPEVEQAGDGSQA